ncbi:MAG: hypothetical protein JO359_06000, partial [Candidatus Eremiobacteraeota bacterium]|nr:hypothetical protein [Candidatus Eremiobacteraeota bacterium]
MSYVSPVNVVPAHIPAEDLKTFGTLESYEEYIEHQARDSRELLEKYRAAKVHDPQLSKEYRAAMKPIMVTTCWGEAQTASQVAQIMTKTNKPSVQYFYTTHAIDETRHTQIEWRRIQDLGLADSLDVPYEQTELFRFVNGLPTFLEIVYGQVCTLEAYSAHVLFNSIADLARANGDLATAATYEHVMRDEVRHIGTGLRLVNEAVETAPDPDEARFRILDLEEKLLPITIRKLGRDSVIAQSLFDAGLIQSKTKFEEDGWRQFKIFRSKITA